MAICDIIAVWYAVLCGAERLSGGLRELIKQHSRGFSEVPSLGALPFLLQFTIDLLYFVLLAVERSDLVGGPSGAEPP